MNLFTSPRTPWLMVMAFFAAAPALFLLGAGRDLHLMPLVLDSVRGKDVQAGIRAAVLGLEEKLVLEEKRIRYRIGEELALAGESLAPPAPSLKSSPPPGKSPAVPPKPRPSAPDPEKVSSARILSHGIFSGKDGFRAVFTANRAFPAPRVFFIAAPSRWVVDIPGDWRGGNFRSRATDDARVQRVAVGEHAQFLRLVFHMRNENETPEGREPRILLEGGSMEIVLDSPAPSLTP